MIQRRHLIYSFEQENLKGIKEKMLNWLRSFNIFSFLDNNNYKNTPNRFDCLMAAGALKLYNNPHHLPQDDWLFGHICYEFGQQFFPKYPWKKKQPEGFPLFSFFQPEIVCYIPFGKNELHLTCLKSAPEKALQEILSTEVNFNFKNIRGIEWQLDYKKEDYIETIEKIRNDIQEGDYYELNFCVKAEAKQPIEDPFVLFQKLNNTNPSPFAAFYRRENHFLLSASPERFLNKTGNLLTAQPIKGTIRRSFDRIEDFQLQEHLKNDIKEQAENLMITDLMRNDLAKICETGSICVPELLGIYHFPTLHHLISTIQGKIKPNVRFSDTLEAIYPMGSMSGAPKKIVMERIDSYEKQARGLYSGSVGYIMPNGDFDLSVVIRSILYNEKTQDLSYATGGAITYDSIGEKEWQEVTLKAASMRALFS